MANQNNVLLTYHFLGKKRIINDKYVILFLLAWFNIGPTSITAAGISDYSSQSLIDNQIILQTLSKLGRMVLWNYVAVKI